MIGPRVGVRGGVKVGVAGGVSSDELGSSRIAGVTYDAASGKACPASAAEWALVLAAAGLPAGNPVLLWLLQEAAGNAADSIGTFTGTATAVAYQAAVANWARKGIGVAQLSSGQVVNADAGLPDLSATSTLIFNYIGFGGGVGTARPLVVMGVAVKNLGQMMAPPGVCAPRMTTDANIATGASSETANTGHLFMMQMDRTNSVSRVLTETQIVTPAYTATPTGKSVGLGSNVPNDAAGATFMYTALFAGAAAEKTTAQLRALANICGWNTSW